MSRPPSAIENPVTGERIEFRSVPSDGADDPLVVDYFLAPGGFAVGKFDHVHPHQEERFAVQSGRLGVRIDGDEWTATPGTKFAVPPETAHTVWNDGSGEVHAVVEITPGLSIAWFFETMYGLARDGRTNAYGLPNPLQLAVIVRAFRDEIFLAGLPRRLQQAGAALLAPVGRSVGYRATYPRYGGGARTPMAR